MYYAWFKGRGATINTNGSNLLSVILTSPPFSLSLSPAEPLPLMDLCRRAARLALGRERLQEIESLPLPQSLKNYLQYQWLTPAEPTGSTRTQTRPPERLKMDGWKRLIKEKGLLDGRMSTLMDLYKKRKKKRMEMKDGGWTDGESPGSTAPASFGFPAAFLFSFCFLFFLFFLTWNKLLMMVTHQCVTHPEWKPILPMARLQVFGGDPVQTNGATRWRESSAAPRKKAH